MLKKIVLLGVIAVSLTGCIVAPLDDGYDRDGRGGYGHRHDFDRRWDKRHDDRRGDYRYKDQRQNHDHRDRPSWNWNDH